MSNPLQSTPQFDAVAERQGNLAIVRVSGEVDIATAPKLRECLRGASDEETALVVVDLSAVTLLDSTGLGALIEHLSEVGNAPRRLDMRLVVSEPHVLKVFTVTGLDQVFKIYSSFDRAISAVD